MLARIPKKTANIAVEIIGTPGTKYGVIASASTQAERASTRSVLLIKRGQRSPKNAAGTAASKPQAAGLPIACAPSAPAKVKIFQKIKTPIPVSQNPCRASFSPRCSCERATPVYSSIVICAASIRRNPLTFSTGAMRSP